MKKISMFVVLVAIMAAFSVSQAATVDLTTGTVAVRMAGAPTPVILEKTVDFATAGAVTGDVVRAICLPAGTKVDEVYFKVLTSNLVASTVNIGDATTAAKWGSVDAVTVTSGAVNSASNVFYTATGYINLTLNGPTPTQGKILLKATVRLYGETATR